MGSILFGGRDVIEKFVMNVELIQMLQAEFTPLEINEGTLAFDATTRP